ncbi:hypothetical protein T484DRAFT_1777803 [Baffinella frigidus]|nr:hypothetical protein T484DRAFT_1777803 [Cryptophyta sp. CCMP2293]
MRMNGAAALLVALQGVGIAAASAAFVSPGCHGVMWPMAAHRGALPGTEVRPPLRSGICAARMMFNLPGMDSDQRATAEKAKGAKDTSRTQVIIEKDLQHCFNVAANLDGYLLWCRKGGMKDVQVRMRLSGAAALLAALQGVGVAAASAAFVSLGCHLA